MSIGLILSICIPLFLVVLGKVVGSRIERQHYESIRHREQHFSDRPALSTKTGPSVEAVSSATLAIGSVVVSVDHFKRFVSGFRMFFGGEVRSYSSLIDRARREAVLRMKESQPDADAYVNTRLETSTIASTTGDEGIGTIEVLAYATAVHYDRAP